MSLAESGKITPTEVVQKSCRLFSDLGLSTPLRSPLFSKNPFRRFVVARRLSILTKFIDLARSEGSGSSIALDFGPGFGVMLPILAERFGHVQGVDVDSEQLHAAIALTRYFQCKNVDLTLVEPEAELDAIETSSVDCVLAADVLEHISNPTRLIQEFARILAPKGVLAVSLPTESRLYRVFECEEAGHQYHDFEGFLAIEAATERLLNLVRRRRLYTFFSISAYVKVG